MLRDKDLKLQMDHSVLGFSHETHLDWMNKKVNHQSYNQLKSLYGAYS